ncbi:MAG: hypothetical protein GY798_31485 [Hyphomicrobiales bacterium]|nr:hypothetical protein [Hyphomicrobiales bacterium]
MKRTFPSMLMTAARTLMVLSLLPLLAALTVTSASATGRFDGTWKVYVYATTDECAFGYRLPITINDGDVLYNGRRVHPRIIDVSSGGAVAINLGSGRNIVTGSGALNSRRGSGRWSAPRYQCTGWWRAVKQ